jgi:beta-N-acetylhexosaminidase
MRQVRSYKKWYIMVLPLVLGLALYGVASAVDWGPSGPPPNIQEFEFTVWRDTIHGDSWQNGLIITLSEREKTRASLLVLQNRDSVLPFQQLQEKNFHLLVVGEPLPTFTTSLEQYAAFSTQRVSSIQGLRAQDFGRYTPVVVALHQPRENRSALLAFLSALRQETEVVVINFGDVERLHPLKDFPTLVQVPHARRIPQEVAGQLLFGGVGTSRPLPDDLALRFELDQSHRFGQERLAYSEPEYVGVSSDSLARIEAIVREGIDQYAMPGCQVLVAKEGHVIYHRAFGYHTYEQRSPVQLDDLYDIASVTKVAATTLATMRLVEAGKMELDQPLRRFFRDPSYLPSSRVVYDTVKLPRPPLALAEAEALPDSSGPALGKEAPLPLVGDTLRLSDTLGILARVVRSDVRPRRSQALDVPLHYLLTHHSGLQAGLPIGSYMRYLSSRLFSPVPDDHYRVPVAEHFFLRENYLDSLWNDTKGMRSDTGRYRYSCANMVLVQQAIDSINQISLASFLDSMLYRPLGLQTLGYNPRQRFDPERLVPTSQDRWRNQMLCGTVHDPTAALLGGVSGNAGLFSNANDLAIIGQMLLNQGRYGGERYYSPETVQRFTDRQRGHRGLGWDKPPSRSDYIVAPSASPRTFGHTGFTGACFWVDPEHEIVFVFLSNRVHPHQDNQRINRLRIRQRVHQVIYDAMDVPTRFDDVPEPRSTTPPPFLMAMGEED